MSGLSYETSGVSLKRGDDFADYIRNLPSGAVSRGIGGFAGGAPLDLKGYKEPLLLSTTDGVGTKLLVAKALGRWDTVGIDLVAMSVNDLVVCGAKPLQFLDYIACGSIKQETLRDIIGGVVKGCEQAGCLLVGGETAEMPGLYAPDDLDLAGFSVGIVEKSEALPRLAEMSTGDLLLGLPSSGLHSNGYSLARKCIPESDKEGWRLMLEPTRIYVKEVLGLIATGQVLGAAHITGSGLLGNLERVIPPGLVPQLSWDWPRAPIFDRVQKGGAVSDSEMRSVFNMGIGMVLVVRKSGLSEVLAAAKGLGTEILTIGELSRG